MRWLLQAVRNGFAETQNRMGYLYERGTRVPPDYQEAIRLFNSAAEQNLLAAQCNLGHMYHTGKGVPVDYARAVDLYRQAAAQGWRPLKTSWGSHICVVPASQRMRL
jgi:uncharacterized protein